MHNADVRCTWQIGHRAKDRKHKWNGFCIQKDGLNEVWKTKRIEFKGDISYYWGHNLFDWNRYKFGITLVSPFETKMSLLLGGLQFRRENSKNDFDFIVRYHRDSTRQTEKSKRCQIQLALGRNKTGDLQGFVENLF